MQQSNIKKKNALLTFILIFETVFHQKFTKFKHLIHILLKYYYIISIRYMHKFEGKKTHTNYTQRRTTNYTGEETGRLAETGINCTGSSNLWHSRMSELSFDRFFEAIRGVLNSFHSRKLELDLWSGINV